MGADLYIRSLNDAAEAQYKPLFEAACTARDSYAERNEVIRNRETGEFTDPEYLKLQAVVHEAYENMYEKNGGYFRDSYNSTSLFWLLDLSWWNSDAITQDGDDDDDDAYPVITVASAARLLDEIEAKEVTAAMVAAMLEKNRERVGDPSDLAGWTTYFQEKRERFIAFLKRAIALNEPIQASV